MRIDACIWFKNSAKLLLISLKRFDEVLPRSVIGNKIAVDYHSDDASQEIAEAYGWTVYQAPRVGIASAANEAFRHVETEFCITLEADCRLAYNWWPTVFNYLEDPKVAAAQGVRLAINPKLRPFVDGDYAWAATHGRYWSFDNLIMRADIVRQVGGVPTTCRYHGDLWLRKAIIAAGYRWVVDPNVVSDHWVTDCYAVGRHLREQNKMCSCKPQTTTRVLLRELIYSPYFGIKFANRYHSNEFVLGYPYMCAQSMRGRLEKLIRERNLL